LHYKGLNILQFPWTGDDPNTLRLSSTSLNTNHMKTDFINYFQLLANLALSFGDIQTKVHKVDFFFFFLFIMNKNIYYWQKNESVQPTKHTTRHITDIGLHFSEKTPKPLNQQQQTKEG